MAPSYDAPLQSPLNAETPGDAAAGQSLRRRQIIPPCISHALFPVPENSAGKQFLVSVCAPLCLCLSYLSVVLASGLRFLALGTEEGTLQRGRCCFYS